MAAVHGLLMIVLLTTAAQADPPPLVVGSAFEPPLSNPLQTGLMDNVTREAFRRIGQAVEIRPLPAERSLINADAGYTDGDLLRIHGMDERYPNLVQVPEKSMDFEFVCFTRRGEIEIADWDDLAPYVVGIVRGWKILEESVAAQTVTAVDDLEILMGLLELERVDLVIHERLEGMEMARRIGLADVRALEPPIAVRPMFLYLNRSHEGLARPLADALRDMKSDGSYARLTGREPAP